MLCREIDFLKNFVHLWFQFKNDCFPLVPCFDQPVQANQRNIREFKEYLNKLDTQNIANFSLALTEAFELLQRVSAERVVSCGGGAATRRGLQVPHAAGHN